MPLRTTRLAALCLVLTAGSAPAHEPIYEFDLGPQPVPQILAALARQTGANMAYPKEGVKGLQSPGVKGRYSLRDALAVALNGTGLTHEFTAGNAVRIQVAKTTEVGKVVEIWGEADSAYATTVATTGTKTDTPILLTPAAIQVIPQQVLIDQKAVTLDQAIRNVSGVSSHAWGKLNENLTMRGFTTATTFIDGFRLDQNLVGGTTNMTNVESVEVLKGPAAILYGRVEPGGMVNTVTKQPQALPAYAFEVIGGSWDRYATHLNATGPINADKTLLYRVDASYEKDGSWRHFVKDDRTFVSGALKWILSSQTDLSLKVQHDTSHSAAYTDAQPYDTDTNQIVWLPWGTSLYQPDTALTLKNTLVGLTFAHRFNASWSVRAQLVRNDNTTMTPPGGYYFPASFEKIGNAWSAYFMAAEVHGGNKTTASILDLTGHFSTGALKHTLLFGADYYRYDNPYENQYATGMSVAVDPFHPALPVPALPLDPADNFISGSRTNSWGLYLQDQIELPHNVHVLLGLRQQDARLVDNWQIAGTGPNQGGTGLREELDRTHDSALTPRLGLLWLARPWLSLYGSYTENFGAAAYGKTRFGKPLKPESARQSEVGAKTQFFGGKLTASLALFDLTKTRVAVADAPPYQQFFITIGAIRSKGTELDIQGEIRPGWNVIFTHAYTDIRISKSSPDEGFWVVGNRLGNVPWSQSSLSTTYDLKGASVRGWKIGGGFTQRASATDYSNTIPTSGYTLWNAMAAYDFKVAKAKATAQLNLENLANRRAYRDLGWGGTFSYLNWEDPRALRLSLRVEF